MVSQSEAPAVNGSVKGPKGKGLSYVAKLHAQKDSDAVKPAKIILDTQNKFELDIRSHVPPASFDPFSVRELSALENIVREMQIEAETSKDQWAKNRSKTSRHVQNFTTRFSQFLESYSGIVEVLKGADQQYGGVAYGTLSVFLVVRSV